MKSRLNLKTVVFIFIILFQINLAIASDNSTGVTIKQTVPSSKTSFGEMEKTETPPADTQHRMIHKHGRPAPIKASDNQTGIQRK
ncbi:hypothetical protein [Candidatus Magnetomonas plexicatena]|uniref:hypothetical protein n=1 Tax=Candidatus Magnetomonas plexicatena TaxID=2552947 RepID=UPI001C785B48|nr:hypothetical protein E2O03_004895 [Nitrospirales bacterium LBB_01]